MPEQIKCLENNDEIQRGRWRAGAKLLPSSVGSRNPPWSVDSLGLEFAGWKEVGGMVHRQPSFPLTSLSPLHVMSCNARSQSVLRMGKPGQGEVSVSRFSGAMEMKQLGVRQITKRGSGVEGLSAFLHLCNIYHSGSSGCPVWVCVCMCMCTCKYARLPRARKVGFAAFDCVLPDITPDRCSFSGRMFGEESVRGYSAVRLSIART